MNVTNIKPMNLGAPMATINMPAIKYKSGNRIWYAMTIPYRALGKFVNTSSAKKKNQEIIKSEIRNRFLDSGHKTEIKNYINEEPEFTIPPVTLVSYEELDFRAYTVGEETQDQQNQRFEGVGSIAGIVILPIDYEFECLDGNHRTAAIRDLASENPQAIADSNMLLNIVYENRARKIRQDFVDVNKNAKQTSSSINTLFNTRDKVSGLVVDLIEELDYLKNTTELLSTSVSKNSKDIYTINNIKNAVIEVSGFNSQSTKVEKISNLLKNDEQFESEMRKKSLIFFEELGRNNVIQQCINDEEKISLIRNGSLITSGTGIIIASRVGGYILNLIGVQNAEDEKQARNELGKLFDLDWSRESDTFYGNVIGSEQKIINSRDAISSAAKAVMIKLDYYQEEEENEKEEG